MPQEPGTRVRVRRFGISGGGGGLGCHRDSTTVLLLNGNERDG